MSSPGNDLIVAIGLPAQLVSRAGMAMSGPWRGHAWALCHIGRPGAMPVEP